MLKEAPRRRDETEEADLAARAAWLHFSGGMTQGHVAKRLGVSNVKAHRLIARAMREGLVHIIVEADVSECIAIEDILSDRYGLEYCRVAPDLAEATPLPLKALGITGAAFLKGEIERGDYDLIGIGHGRTLAAAVNAMPPVAAGGTRFVSVFGGLSRRFAASPYDVIHRLAERTGGEAYQIPLPTFANSVKDRDVLLAQPGIAEVFELACTAPIIFAGIGDLNDNAFLITSGMLNGDEVRQLREAGAVGELLGHYFDRRGQLVAESFTARALAPDMTRLRRSRLVALAGGSVKALAIEAVLNSRVLDGLIVDEVTARQIVDATDAA